MKAKFSLAAVFAVGSLLLTTGADVARAGFPFGSSASESNANTPASPTPQQLLQAARDEMAKGNLSQAEAYIREAEKNSGTWQLNPLADTPAKARRDLEKKKRDAVAAERPSQKARPSLISSITGGERPGRKDPFQGTPADNNDGILYDKKPQALVYLRKSREALEQGNLPAASHYHRMAAEQGAAFGPDEDSPARLAGEIRRRGGQVTVSDPPASPEGVLGETRRFPVIPEPQSFSRGSEIAPLAPRHQTQPGRIVSLGERGAGQGNHNPQEPTAGDRLLLEARRAVAVGDTRRALSLAAEARALGKTYGPLDDSPTKIEDLVRRYDEVMRQRSSRGDSELGNRLYAQLLLEEAEGLIRCKDYETAERLAADAAQLRAEFAPFENSPRTVMDRIAAARRAGQASHQAPLDTRAAADHGVRTAEFDGQRGSVPRGGEVASAGYDPRRDRSRTIAAAAEDEEPIPGSEPVLQPQDATQAAERGAGEAARSAPSAAQQPNEAAAWVRRGDEALERRDHKTAMECYRRAAAQRGELDPGTAQYLQNRLQLLQGAVAPRGSDSGQLLEETSDTQQRFRQQMAAEIARASRKAMDMREDNPRGAIAEMRKIRVTVEQSSLTPDEKKAQLARIDRMVAETERYIEQHKSEIELNERNEAITNQVKQERTNKVQVQERLAILVDEYNRLCDEERWAEAEAKAKQAREIAPDEAVTTMMWRLVRIKRNNAFNQDLADDKENKVIQTYQEIETAAVPWGKDDPVRFVEKPEWEALTIRRRSFGRETERKRSPKELEIEQKLRTPVSLSFREAPLSEVLDHLKRVTAVNIYVDPQGLGQEGVHPSVPVTIDLGQEISLKSALNLILEPLHLGYVVKDEVLKITSEQYKSGNLHTLVYNVGDLVIPIPDFAPHNRIGLPAAIDDAYQRTANNIVGGYGFQPPVVSVASNAIKPSGLVTPETVLAQQLSGGLTTGGNRGGTASADFDAVIDLISKTIEPESWSEVGGPGSIKPSAGNLSLVISQTQDVHDKIADLLNQLRRLQDLQVTIEVRFITLSDDFFERIGVDFDFNIRSRGSEEAVAQAELGQIVKPSATVGWNPDTGLSPAISFTQNSFDQAVPTFGGFDPTMAATFGIAILSDLEAFLFVTAAQGDSRTNIMQAPRVTLFNGQAASISDQSQTPFVTSVTPIVGDFAAAQAPVIVVLNAGTTLSVQAVVSNDRRFVRLTLVPFFSQIGDVDEFMFTGTTTTKSSSSNSSSDMGDTTSDSDEEEVITDGTTVQLPTFIFTTVTTTVSVPDGGTVLLGGIKRLSEDRKEFGLPVVGKIPYLNRLFKNVGIGREAESLMLMVTPRIIILEEEEARQGLTPQ